MGGDDEGVAVLVYQFLAQLNFFFFFWSEGNLPEEWLLPSCRCPSIRT